MTKPDISPQRWTPPRVPTKPRYLPMPNLEIHPVPGSGPEHVLPAPDGHLLTGLADGRIISYDPETRRHTLVVDTGGRPLGLGWHPDGSLLICDTARGLLRHHPDGALQTLATGYGGKPSTFCSNVAAAADGTIYFSHSSGKFTEANWTGDLFEHRPTGQLFRLSPDGALDLMLDQLAFANGVILAPDQSFVLVAETTGYDHSPHQQVRCAYSTLAAISCTTSTGPTMASPTPPRFARSRTRPGWPGCSTRRLPASTCRNHLANFRYALTLRLPAR